MKKLMIALAAVAMAAAANAASINWKYTGVQADTGYTLYLFSTKVSDNYETFAAFTAGNLTSGTVVAKKAGPKVTNYVIAQSTLANDVVTKGMTMYFALIEDGDAETYTFGELSTGTLVYDPEAQEAAPGTLEITSNMLTGSGTIGEEPIPEPTSGLLMLLGMAGLALKRKRA